MLKLMPIPHVPHMKEIIPTSRRTNNCGPDVNESHTSNTNMNHG